MSFILIKMTLGNLQWALSEKLYGKEKAESLVLGFYASRKKDGIS